MRHGFWFAAALLAVVTPIAGDASLKLRLSQAAATAPATLIVQVSFVSDADNRSLAVAVDSEQYFRESQISLDGDDTRRTHTFEFRNLPSGSYVIRAVLRGGGDRPKAVVEDTIVVY